MSFKELGEKTLIPKGTLTGVIDRLEAKGRVTRTASMEDRRSMIVWLPPEGEAMFRQTFMPHVKFCKQAFVDYSDDGFAALERELVKLKAHLEAAFTKART